MRRRSVLIGAGLAALVIGAAVIDLALRERPARNPARFGFGTPATVADIRDEDTDVTPDGKGLPHGSGTVAQGESVYKSRCSACHGVTGTEGPAAALVGRAPGDSFNFGRDPELLDTRTVGNYWPYATTLYDYINRAMPFDAPASLSSDEVYSVVAYLLYRNQIVPANAVMNERSLPLVHMPARDRFVIDNRTGGRTVR
ncbi:MAG TPA: cytochrome c [Gemmatimonadaceae bacterium]|nr:cytochrome c [Gemmatimonadaceae bacterium]